MSKPAIVVDNISKAYRIGLKQERFPTFRDVMVSVARAPLQHLRRFSRDVGDAEDTFWALKDVSFEVQPGEVVGIIGRNGAGKSTLLKLLSRITEPTSGEVRIRGRVASLLEVGTGFHPELTGRENIYLNGAILGMKRAEITRKFDEIVAFAETEKFLDTPVKHYSSGMFVRLAFAVAAHLEPEILIVDEVLAVGDAEFQKKCLGKMQEVATGQGRTVLFVSHNMAAVKSLCRTAVLLSGGTLQVVGSVADVVERYSSTQMPTERSCITTAGDFVLRQVTFASAEGTMPRTFADALLSIHLTSLKDCSDIGVHVLIEDDSGSLIAGLDSRACGLNRSAAAQGDTCITFPIRDMPLLPGDYHLRVVLRNDATYVAVEIPSTYDVRVVAGGSIYGCAQTSKHLHGVVGMHVGAKL